MRSGDADLFTTLAGDGRPLLVVAALALLLAGAFAIFLSVTGHFLPHDVEYLGMTPQQLCGMHQCRIVHFMIHDRASFGGAIFAVGLLYLWLVHVPLRQRQAWAWWALTLSGAVGFASFLAYLGYGYLDTWHGLGTLALLPCFVIGLAMTYHNLPSERSWRTLLKPAAELTRPGRIALLATAVGLIVGGVTILVIGMSCVFVPQDLAFMGLDAAELERISPRLVPLIAHDRAGFGGGAASAGIALLCCVWCGQPTRSLWQTQALAGLVGFGLAIGVHPAVGYTDPFHLAPAVAGALLLVIGLLRGRPASYSATAFRPGNPLRFAIQQPERA